MKRVEVIARFLPLIACAVVLLDLLVRSIYYALNIPAEVFGGWYAGLFGILDLLLIAGSVAWLLLNARRLGRQHLGTFLALLIALTHLYFVDERVNGMMVMQGSGVYF